MDIWLVILLLVVIVAMGVAGGFSLGLWWSSQVLAPLIVGSLLTLASVGSAIIFYRELMG